MDLVANENLPAAVVEGLRAAGHGVLWIRESFPGISDVEVMEKARASGRVLITFDKDFGELVFRHGLRGATGIILLRLPQPSPSELAVLVTAILDSRDDWAGHFAVVSSERIRMIRLR
jgi:predicted nuclease of predicted toxin-antitoxin system